MAELSIPPMKRGDYMARIVTASGEKVFTIKRWLGLNENPDGETNLKIGEASEMENFKVTIEGSLQVRPGTQTVAVLSESKPVKGIWAGYINGEEVLVAACDDKVWLVNTENEAYQEIGDFETANGVHFFGYDEKLYTLNGTKYCSWDGGKHWEHSYTALGIEPLGFYYMTVNGTHYVFSVIAGMSEGDTYVYNEYDGSFTLNGENCPYTTTLDEYETDLTDSMVSTEVLDPLLEVGGYRPLILTETLPTGGGTALERINLLNGLRRARFSPDVSGTTEYQLPETGLSSIDYVRNRVTGSDYTLTTDYSVDLTNGTVTFVTAPAIGTDTIEIGYTYPTNYRAQIEAMRYAETYNGTTDNRVFLYGDGTNKAFYSDLDYNGFATAEYFPDLNVIHVGDANTPITGLIRHYSRLLAFKEDSAYSIFYNAVTLADGTVTAGFYLAAVNKIIGNCALGQAQLVENHPITLDGNSIYQWKATSTSGDITGDQRNANRISGRIQKTLSEFSLPDAVTFTDKFSHEYYVAQNGKAVVYSYGTDSWYVYTNFPATCFALLDGALFMGTSAGSVMHVSREYRSDDGADIPARWTSGYMDFGADFRRKDSAMLWMGMLPEAGGRMYVTLDTDNKSNYSELVISRSCATFAHVNFAEYSFSANRRPTMKRLRLKAKKFIYYKLIITAGESSKTATVIGADIRVRYTGNVR